MPVEFDLSRVSELARMAVPSWVQGVWQRERIRTSGHESREPLVIWVQTPTLYADIRALMPDQATTVALREEGFAGWLDVQAQVCNWHRPIDLHPGPEDGDQGAMFIDGDAMVEVGLLSNYLEEYKRIERPERCFAASRGEFSVASGKVWFAPETPLEIVVAVGKHVIHGRRGATSGLRYGRYEPGLGVVSFEFSVGDSGIFAQGDGTWTVWTDAPDRDVLLAAASA